MSAELETTLEARGDLPPHIVGPTGEHDGHREAVYDVRGKITSCFECGFHVSGHRSSFLPKGNHLRTWGNLARIPGL